MASVARLAKRSPHTCGLFSGPAGILAASQNSTLRRAIHIFRNVPPLREHRRNLLHQGETVGLVPTMGALHRGHIDLVREAANENSKVFVSIYVNPTQFGVNEDLDKYPRTWDTDMQQLHDLENELKSEGKGTIDAVFVPTTKTMYPTLPPDSTIPGTGSFVTITPLANLLEGKSRPVFFRGVATVCMKLFNIVEPERVYFGQKDVQQTVIIKRMVEDFHNNTEVRIVSTARESDGLAMSSRNQYLGERRRKVAVVLSQALKAGEASYLMGKRSRDDILALAWDVLNRMGMEQDSLPETERVRFEPDYLSLADTSTLEEVELIEDGKGAVLSCAIKMLPLERKNEGEALGEGEDEVTVRLIDNVMLEPRDT